MPRLKVRCASCGKVFTPANAKQTLCPDCEKAQRAAKAQKRAEAATPAQAQQPSAPLIQGPGARVLRPEIAQAEAIADAPTLPAASELAPAHDPSETAHERPQQPQARAYPPATKRAGRSGSQDQHKRKTQHSGPTPFLLNDELLQRIDARYLELANPV